MTYLVVETHLSHCIVLDESGRLIKAANFNYQIGDTISQIFPMESKSTQFKPTPKFVMMGLTLMSVFILAFVSLLNINTAPYATIALSINPKVQLNINKQDEVVKVKALNADGKTLISGYKPNKNSIDQVIDDLLARAKDLGLLERNRLITLSYDSKNQTWIQSHMDTKHQLLLQDLSDSYDIDIIMGNPLNNENTIIRPKQTPTQDESSKQDEDQIDDSNSLEDKDDAGNSDIQSKPTPPSTKPKPKPKPDSKPNTKPKPQPPLTAPSDDDDDDDDNSDIDDSGDDNDNNDDDQDDDINDINDQDDKDDLDEDSDEDTKDDIDEND